jgi:hypothetical protein
MRVLWVSALLVFACPGTLYQSSWKYHYRHSGERGKERMITSKQISHYYYDRWYTPADSTEIECKIKKLRKKFFYLKNGDSYKNKICMLKKSNYFWFI